MMIFTNKQYTVKVNYYILLILYVDKKYPVMRPNLQPKIYKSPVVA
jgi:hypothetical protein